MSAPDPGFTLAFVLRQDRGRILAAVIARTGDFDLAEEALAEASAAALLLWARSGVPDRPLAWLIRVAFRKAIDRLRRRSRDLREQAALALLARDEAEEEAEMIADERLRLIFTCCHPALDPKSRVALTLRTIAGLSTAEIAAAFLDSEATMGQRLSRAKTKITAAGIPFAVPEPQDWGARLNSVLTVIYLIFNAGYSAGPAPARDLCQEAVFLARLLVDLRPEEAEVEACLALLLLTHCRRDARLDASGITIALGHQDRSRWHSGEIAEGLGLIACAMARNTPGPFQLKAAIAACQISAAAPDWPQILALYDRLLDFEATPVVALNRAVALAETGNLRAALQEVQALRVDLADYQPYYAALADVQAKLGQRQAAGLSYDQAIARARSSADAAFLAQRRKALRL